MRLLMTYAALMFVACSGSPPPATTPEPAPAPAPEAAPEPAPKKVSAQSMYDECKGRVEGPSAAGECTKDDDCAVGGSSGEVCVTTLFAAELVTAAEKMPCFAVLDTCTCQKGTCTWTVKDEVPEGTNTANPTGRGQKLPPSLPPGGKAKGKSKSK
jgi:eight-cysteine-cluster-containing protein